MNTSTRIKLSLMMFLQFFIWGAWYNTMNTYLDKVLHANGIQIGAAYSAMAIATIFSPFIVGMIVDKYFAAQKVLSILHIGGAIVLFYVTTVSNPNTFYWLILLYSLMYAPTLALVNSVAFRQMQDTSKEFASIRVLGTIGWIATGWLIDKVFRLGALDLAFTFKMAATASVLLGLLSLILPNTPPKSETKSTFGQIREALVLFKNSSFTVFFIASIFICIPLSFYYSLTNLFLREAGMQNATSNMTFGQISEAVFILLIPFFFRRLGVKWMIAVGMIAWSVRFLFFAYGNSGPLLWMLFAGIILHGVCFDFFFVTGQIYTDSKAGLKIKSSAQGMITMATYGVGMWIGSLLSGFIKDLYTVNNVVNWKSIWIVPAVIAAIVLILFLLLFRDKESLIAKEAEPVFAV